MARPVKWSRDLHSIRERVASSKIETWRRTDIEHYFGVGRVTAQTLQKAIGGIQQVGGAHFIERTALVGFLDAMIAAPDVDQALRSRLSEADSPPRSTSLRISLPTDLRRVTVNDLNTTLRLTLGCLEIKAGTIEELVDRLVEISRVLQDDPEGVRDRIEGRKVPPQVEDDEMRLLFAHLRELQRQRGVDDERGNM